MSHKDCLGQEIKTGARVLWSSHNSHSGFDRGVMLVVAITPKRIRVEDQTTKMIHTAPPESVVVVDKLLAPSE